MISPQLKKGSTELLILSLLADQEYHGYEIGKQIEQVSGGRLQVGVSTLYPVLYRMESRGWIKGRWLEKPGQRRRCSYRLTPMGETVLAEKRQQWQEFTRAVNLVVAVSHA